MTQKYSNRKKAYGVLTYIRTGFINKNEDMKVKDLVNIINEYYNLSDKEKMKDTNWFNANRDTIVRAVIPFNELKDDIRKLEPYLKGEIQNNTTDQNITINKSDFDDLMVRLSELEKENMILKNKLNNI